MPQLLAPFALHVVAVVDGVHLVHPDIVQPVGAGLDRVEHGGGFAVGEWDDQLRAAGDVTKDSITSEYRGSVVLERYLDLTDPRLKTVDFATGAPGSKPSLDAYHRIRVLNQKRFDP